jgi:hypothetical protein
LGFKAAASLPQSKALRAFSCNVVSRRIMESALGTTTGLGSLSTARESATARETTRRIGKKILFRRNELNNLLQQNDLAFLTTKNEPFFECERTRNEANKGAKEQLVCAPSNHDRSFAG